MEDVYFWSAAYFRTQLFHGVGNGTGKYRGSWYITITSTNLQLYSVKNYCCCFICIFCICVFFCHSCIGSYAAAEPWNSRVIREEKLGRDEEGCVSGQVSGNISLFAWKDWGKLRQIPTSSHEMRSINRYLKRKPLETWWEIYRFG